MKRLPLSILLVAMFLSACSSEKEPQQNEADPHFLSGHQKAIDQAKAMSGTLEEAARQRDEALKKQLGK
ncbi:hypothetical protein [Kistimonas asteriae]|uniref:hypothetical protein n=1 Tax=Kistimonas asteriae TaxID=517724 RepID=UPI001BA7D294|nr:hypothetical protein [Kistimonas asteriae]